jgi:hypothetical protein
MAHPDNLAELPAGDPDATRAVFSDLIGWSY